MIMIDDVLVISNCDNEAVEMNAIIHSKIDTKAINVRHQEVF